VSWRTEVLEPATMSTADIRAELRHDLDVYDRVQDPVSKMAMAARINELVVEMDARASTQGVEE
jgi:hypothetical protein